MDYSDEGLEKVLNALSNKYRIQILRFLKEQPGPVSFSEIENAIYTKDKETVNITHHLQTLQGLEIIKKNEKNKYYLTEFGKSVEKGLIDFKELIFDKASIKVRTSKYTLEEFNEQKIIDTLLKEANIPPLEAEDIAREAKKRLIEANVEYLTAPLIREYINSILIEKGMENYRHKLTRLGTPPYDIKKILDRGLLQDPDEMIKKFGTDTLEQYTLLNILPPKLADLILMGRYSIGDLARFSFSPLEIVISSNKFIELLKINYITNHTQNRLNDMHLEGEDFNTLSKKIDILALQFGDFEKNLMETISTIKSFFPKGLLIYNFEEFIERFEKNYSYEQLDGIIKKGFSRTITNYNIALEINSNCNIIYLKRILDIYEESLETSYWWDLPRLDIFLKKESVDEIIKQNPEKLEKKYGKLFRLIYSHNISLILYRKHGHPELHLIYTPGGVPIELDPTLNETYVIEGDFIVDLLRINKKREITENEFLKSLENSLQQLFDYCDLNKKNIGRNLGKFLQWPDILGKVIKNTSNQFKMTLKSGKKHIVQPSDFENTDKLIDDSIYSGDNNRADNGSSGLERFIKRETKSVFSISLSHLNGIVKKIKKLDMGEQRESREFGVKITDFVYKMLEKQNQMYQGNIKFVLYQYDPISHTIEKYRKLEDPDYLRDLKYIRENFMDSITITGELTTLNKDDDYYKNIILLSVPGYPGRYNNLSKIVEIFCDINGGRYKFNTLFLVIDEAFYRHNSEKNKSKVVFHKEIINGRLNQFRIREDNAVKILKSLLKIKSGRITLGNPALLFGYNYYMLQGRYFPEKYLPKEIRDLIETYNKLHMMKEIE